MGEKVKSLYYLNPNFQSSSHRLVVQSFFVSDLVGNPKDRQYFFDLSVFETTAVVKICKFTVFSSSSFCQIYRVTDKALIAETMVWPNFFLINVFFAFKRSKLLLLFLINDDCPFMYISIFPPETLRKHAHTLRGDF